MKRNTRDYTRPESMRVGKGDKDRKGRNRVLWRKNFAEINWGDKKK